MHPAVSSVPMSDVHVPVAVVDRRHLQPDVGLDQPRDVAAARRRGRVVGVRRRRSPGCSRPPCNVRAVCRARPAPCTAGPGQRGRARPRADRAAPRPTGASRRRSRAPSRSKRSTDVHRELGARALGTRGGTCPTADLHALERRARCPRRPSTRSIQPVRSEVPGAARSISSIASKCERFGSAMPTACTTPNVPASQNGFSGAIAGCIPNVGVELDQREPCGIADVRAAAST